MKFVRNFFYLLGQGIVGVFRNSVMSTASILVLVCCMLIVGTFGLVVKAINDNLQRVDTLNVIVAYINPAATDEDIQKMKKDIESYSTDITVEYVDKKTGLERLKEEMGSEIDLEMYLRDERLNPLPDTFEINFSSAEGAEALNNYINNLDNITDTRHKIGLVEKVNTASKGLMAIAVILMGVLLLVALFVIMNTIKLGVFARRDEIAVMRYVGATNTFIITPFLIEGIIIGTFSACLAYGIQYYLYTQVISDIVRSYGIGTIAPFGETAFVVGAGFLGIGLFAGIIASGISIKRYLSE
ncbi:MAG: permease-like cell division protein FtsX [Eubacteriales bacterium]|nr:permease-like cell division protein FtsX [Eubacteriales bacterium]